MRNKIKGLWFLTLLMAVAAVCEASENIRSLPEAESMPVATEKQHTSLISSKEAIELYDVLGRLVQIDNDRSKAGVELLEAQIKLQSEQIESLKAELAKLRVPEDHDLTAIILTGVAVIVTTLGVLIAILSIYGYRNIKTDSIKSARTAAVDTVSKITPEEISKSLQKLMEGEGFNKLISDAVEKAAYRGINLDDEDENLEDVK
ncbi:hypothetical protein N619_28580 [Ectopseudomonas oleovorans]|nr:hypothetical protein N619_28580 [Pseudomonas oleovorans]